MSLSKRLLLLFIPVIGAIAATGVWADWYFTIDGSTPPHYVGTARCLQCHAGPHRAWSESDHALAMQRATPATVLGDFEGASLEHHGIQSRMFRRGEKFFVHTEGPDGQLHDYEIKYVFGVRPLQQYMVEMPGSRGNTEGIGRVQVLRISWDTERKRWFYLPPPDVPEKLAPSDPLHWTGHAQNWNHMCADCHSTDLQKNFDLDRLAYHTTFSDMNVGCEACHGPGSTHVELASAWSLFWDREHGYGLTRLKQGTHTFQIETCAPCHSRRSMVYPEFRAGEDYHNYYVHELLTPETYYADGQIKDEVYVYGSYIQSKMFAKGVRCTDCHDPHTTRVKFEGNQLCTSCHQHEAAKYDTPAHHQHPTGSSGALCVNCHMPERPYMAIDLRRDHSIRVPRPDLSVAVQVPNACTGCHADASKLPGQRQQDLLHYADWLAAREAGDPDVARELGRLDQWAWETVQRWYPQSKHLGQPHFATTLHAAWQHDRAALPELRKLAQDKSVSSMVRASALAALGMVTTPDPQSMDPAITAALKDKDPMVRLQAVRLLDGKPIGALQTLVLPLLKDPVRPVRQEAAMVTAAIPSERLTPAQRTAREQALAEYREGLRQHSDQASAHMTLAQLAERRGDMTAAIRAYRDAIRVQPEVTGPRSNLAYLMEQRGHAEAAAQLRHDELPLLQRDAELAPEVPVIHYRYGLALYQSGNIELAARTLERAYQLQPESPDFLLAWALILKEQGKLHDAESAVVELLRLRPKEPSYQLLLQEIRNLQ